MDITLTAYDAAETSYTLINTSSPWKLVAYEWGNAVWDQQWSGPRGTLGARPTYSTVQNRQVGLAVRLLPASKGAMPGHLADLANVAELIRRHGGRIAVTTASVTYTQYLEVLAGSTAMSPWTNRAEWAGRLDVQLAFVCEPLVRGASMEVIDRFTTDTRSDYTYDQGSSGVFTVSGGELAPTGTSLAVLVHTATGYQYGDHQACVWAQITSTLTTRVGVVLKRVDASNRLEVYVDDTGAASRLRIDKVVAGVTTNLASAALTRLTANQRFAVQGRIEGNRVYAEYFSTPEDSLTEQTATTSTDVVLTSAEAAVFGKAVLGQAGVVWDPAATGERVDEFRLEPYAYKDQPPVTMYGAVPGDAPALFDLVTYGQAGPFGMFAWSRRPLGENRAPAGDLDDYPTSHLTDPGDPWSHAGVSGVTGAATSKATANGGYKSRKCLSVVCPATANTGVVLRVARRFKAGTSYTVSAYLKSATGTTNARVRLGVSGDIASTTAAALTTSWVQHTTTWTPTADVDLAYFAAEITAATATTFQVDSVQVYETDRAPSIATQTNGRGGQPPVALLDASDAQRLGPNTSHVTGLGSTYRNGTAARFTSASSSSSVAWSIDPDLLDSDQHTGVLDVEVWARMVTPAWSSSGRVAVSITSPSGDASYTREYGSTGKTVPASYTNFSRLGTVAVPRSVGIGRSGRSLLTLTLTPGQLSAGLNWDFDYVVLVPARRRALSPTGKSATGYPTYAPSGGGKIIRPDLSGYYRDDDATGFGPSTGLGGAMLEMDPGEQVAFITVGGIPDRTDASPAFSTIGSIRFRVAPTPRWHYLRDS